NDRDVALLRLPFHFAQHVVALRQDVIQVLLDFFARDLVHAITPFARASSRRLRCPCLRSSSATRSDVPSARGKSQSASGRSSSDAAACTRTPLPSAPSRIARRSAAARCPDDKARG